jgi:hypothetical protein
MLATVLLHHHLLDGSDHFDWLLQRDPDPDSRLIAFRVSHRFDASTGGFDAERIPDHRPLYLTYEGPISGDRGRVTRVAEGTCRIISMAADRLEVDLRLGALGGRFVGIADPGGRGLWRFEPASGPGEPGPERD